MGNGPQRAGCGGQGQDRDVEGDVLPCDLQQPPQAQSKIDKMGHKKAEKIPAHPIFRQENIQKCHIQNVGKNVVVHADPLLSQPLNHCVGDGVAVEHGDKQRVELQEVSRLFAAVELNAQFFCQQVHEPAKEKAVKHRCFQTPPDKIGDPFLASRGGAPGQLRDQQLRQAKQDAGREHQHREYHPADHAEGSKGAFHLHIQRQPFGHHQVFYRADASTHIIRHRQGQGSPAEPAGNRDSWPGRSPFPQAQNGKAPHSQAGPQAAAQHHAQAGPSRIRPSPQSQCPHRNGHRAELLPHLHCGKGPDAVRRGEISRHHPAQAGGGQKRREEPQGGDRAYITDPPGSNGGGKAVDQPCHRPAAQNTVQEAPGEHPADILGPFATQFLRCQVHGGGTDPCHPRHHGKTPHRHG